MNKKWLKQLFTVFFLIGMFFTGVSSLKAASGSVSVKLSSNSAVVGSTVTATVTVSSTDALGSWQATLVYDNSKLQFLSSTAEGQTMIGAGDGNTKNKTYTFKFKAIAKGSGSISINSASIYDWNTESPIGVSKGSASVNIITQEDVEQSYSKNNYLSSLTVEGRELNPGFNKDTLEYSLELEPETPSIKIGASVEDSKSTITGAGDVGLSEGANRIEIKVTAQNGSVRTYVINATVKEYNPIEVTVENQKLTVVRKKGDLTAPNNYTETTVKINNEDVPAFTSTITGLTVVGLKNEAGVIALYSYDGSSTYTKYVELSFHRVILTEQTPDKIPFGFEKKSMKIGENEVTVYWNDKTEKTLLYGMNVETGKQNFYTYEESENTLQIYKEEKNQDEFYLKIMIVLGTTTVLFLGSTIVLTMKLMKHRRIKVKPIPEEDVEETEKESE